MRRSTKGPTRPNIGRRILDELKGKPNTMLDYTKVTPTHLPAGKVKPKARKK